MLTGPNDVLKSLVIILAWAECLRHNFNCIFGVCT